MLNFPIDQTMVDNLISCSKEIVKPFPRDYRIQNRQKRKVLKAISFDGKFNFEIQFHQHVDFDDHFSVLLSVIHLNPNIPRILLFRANSNHGGTRGRKSHIEHHNMPHIHMISANDINNGNVDNPQPIDLNPPYVNFDSALLFFFKRCNIINFKEYFDLNNQLDWFGELYD